MTAHEEAIKDLTFIAENIASKQWQKLTANIENIRKFISQQEKISKLLELYKKIFTKLQFETEMDSYDDSWGMCQDIEVLRSLNKDVEMWTGDEDIIDLFNQIKEIEEQK